MGGKLSSTKKRNERRFLMLGLDGGGKSTLLAQFRGNPIDPVEPTVKSQLHEISLGKWTLRIWDLPGDYQLRPYWRHYFVGAEGIIFVIDATDEERLDSAVAELTSLATDNFLTEVPFLILINKIDQPNALSEERIKEMLQADLILNGDKYIIHSTVATSGQGVEKALTELISRSKKT